MNGSMVPMRTAVILAILLVLVGFGFGVLYWNRSDYKCFDGKRYYGDWVVLISVGKFEVRAKAYGCPASDRYNPAQFRPLYEPSPKSN